MDIRHVVVLMLENRSFDCMLGGLYAGQDKISGLSGNETNTWHCPSGSKTVQVWQSEPGTPRPSFVPDPDPGESYEDIRMQIQGLDENGAIRPGDSTMDGFVDNYMRQNPDADSPSLTPEAVMHYFRPEELPAMTALAKAFGVSDRWHASAPNQTWPNRFFVHTGTAAGYVNNTPTHFPYIMPTVFNRLESVGKTWRVYFHDIPQSATLTQLWSRLPTHFRHFETSFMADAFDGQLPDYTFIEPRYFTDVVNNRMPNDQHPPHDVSYGDALIASVYNAVRSGAGWRNTLLVITYDEHGGCYDHVAPPAAVAPDAMTPDGVLFDRFGVRVPALIISPWVRPGAVVRPIGPTPFDHTSIIATLRALHGFAPLTHRDAVAPSLLDALDGDGSNLGPEWIPLVPRPPTPTLVQASATRRPNGLQHALNIAAIQLPLAGADLAAHTARIAATPDPLPPPAPPGKTAGEIIAAHIKAVLGHS